MGEVVKKKKSIFKRWWFWVVVVIAVIVAANSGGKEETKDASTAVKSTETASPKATATPVELSKEGISSDVKIVVDKVETADKVGDNEFTQKKAQGAFKIVTVTLTNNQKDAITINADSFKLIDDQKREFSYSTEAQFALESSLKGDNKESFFLKKLNPGLSITGHIVYDVPKDAKGFILNARGGLTGKKIQLKVE